MTHFLVLFLSQPSLQDSHEQQEFNQSQSAVLGTHPIDQSNSNRRSFHCFSLALRAGDCKENISPFHYLKKNSLFTINTETINNR